MWEQHSPLTGLLQISAKLSMCLAKCLWRTFSRMPLGWRACKVLYSSSGSLIHHQPRTIAGEKKKHISYKVTMIYIFLN